MFFRDVLIFKGKLTTTTLEVVMAVVVCSLIVSVVLETLLYQDSSEQLFPDIIISCMAAYHMSQLNAYLFTPGRITKI